MKIAVHNHDLLDVSLHADVNDKNWEHLSGSVRLSDGLEWDVNVKQLSIDMVSQILPMTREYLQDSSATVSGSANIKLDEFFGLSRFTTNLKGGAGHVSENSYTPKIHFNQLLITGDVSNNFHEYNLSTKMSVNGSKCIIKATRNHKKSIPNDIFTLLVDRIAVSEISQYFKEGMQSNLKERWSRHIHGGELRKVIMSMKRVQGQEDLFKYSLSTKGVGLLYDENQVSIDDMNALVKGGDKSVTINIESARISDTKLSGATVTIDNFKDANIKITSKIESDDLTDFANTISKLTEAENDFATFGKGNVQGSLQAEYYVGSSDENEKPQIQGNLEFRDADITILYSDYYLKNGNISAVLGGGKITATGTANLNGLIPVKIQGTQEMFYDLSMPNDKFLTIEVHSSGATWKDIYEIHNYIPVVCQENADLYYKMDLYNNNRINHFLKANLKKSSIDFPPLAIDKKSGEKGQFTLRFTYDPEQEQKEGEPLATTMHYTFKLDDAFSKGHIVTVGEELKSVESDEFILRDSYFDISYKSNQNKPAELKLYGASLDMTPINIEKLLTGDSTQGDMNLAIKGDVGTIKLHDNVVLRNASISSGIENGDMNLFVVDGEIYDLTTREKAKDAKSSLYIAFDGKEIKIHCDRMDLGSRGFGINLPVLEGVFDLAGHVEKDFSITGTVNMKDYYFVKEGYLSDLFINILSLPTTNFFSSIKGGVKSVTGGKNYILFDDLYSDFSLSSGGVLKVRNGLARGNTLALTFEGETDLKKNEIDIAGKIMPSNIVDSLAKGIPFLSSKALRQDKANIVSAAYTLKGPLNNPITSVDTLSTITDLINVNRLYEKE